MAHTPDGAQSVINNGLHLILELSVETWATVTLKVILIVKYHNYGVIYSAK